MDVQAEVDAEPEVTQRITAVARRNECSGFADLIGWSEPTIDLTALMNNPGVMFESPRRIVVFHFIAGELRYYAGGWSLSQNRTPDEDERISAEESELGVFATVRDALAFAERYLVAEGAFSQITVARRMVWGRKPNPNTPGRGI